VSSLLFFHKFLILAAVSSLDSRLTVVFSASHTKKASEKIDAPKDRGADGALETA
jgi:hypothetical protein